MMIVEHRVGSVFLSQIQIQFHFIVVKRVRYHEAPTTCTGSPRSSQPYDVIHSRTSSARHRGDAGLSCQSEL